MYFIEQVTDNQMNKLSTIKQIRDNLETSIHFLCHNIYITTDNQVLSLSFKPLKEQLIGGSYCYYCNGKYRSKTWISNNCVSVLGLVTE